MLQALIITLREGIEAFLIVAISLAYLRKTGRERFVSAVYWGIGISVFTSVLAGYLFSLASNQSLWEGILAITASLLIATLVMYMWRLAGALGNQIQSRLDFATHRKSTRLAWMGVLAFTVLMVTREGMEMALLTGTLLLQVKAVDILIGALLGILTAAMIASLWSRFGHRINLGLFLQVTAVFLLVFLSQLLMYGIHELAEADLFPLATQIHAATEPFGPDGLYGKWLSFAPVLVPLGWLGYAWASARTQRSAREWAQE